MCDENQISDEVYREEFAHAGDVAYLDHAGATLYSRSQLHSVMNALAGDLYGNPHSDNAVGLLSSETIEMARYRVLQFFGTDPENYAVVFTSGASASLNMVSDLFNFNPSEQENGWFVYMKECHTSAVGMRNRIISKPGVTISTLPYDEIREMEKSEEIKNIPLNGQKIEGPRGLAVFPAQCNFSGRKYQQGLVNAVQGGCLDDWDQCGIHVIHGDRASPPRHLQWYCMLDAASFVATNPLNLHVISPDFVCLSFYKIFGFPTGLGALLIRRSSADCLSKRYFGGGTVEVMLPGDNFQVFRDRLESRLENGTVSYLDIMAVIHGFDSMHRLAGPMERVSLRVFKLAQETYRQFSELKHSNGSPLVEIYSDTSYTDSFDQGGIVSFNVLASNGEYVGYSTVQRMAGLYNIVLRSGCFCNVGACQRFLKLSNQELRENHDQGHNCGDQLDLVAGKPTGALRVSFGYMSRRCDIIRIVDMLKTCFLHCHSISYRQNHMSMSFTHSGIKNGAILSRIFVYPVKSCSGFSVTSWPLTSSGLLHDRQWMITRRGIVLTQKHNSRLCLISTHVCLGTGMLTLKADGSRQVSIPLEPKLSTNKSSDSSCNISDLRVCNRRVVVEDCGSLVAEWLEEVLDSNGIRLVKYISTNKAKYQDTANSSNSRTNTHENQPPASLSNKSLLTLINETSVAVTLPHEPLLRAMARFRANLHVQSPDSPFIEHSVRSIATTTTDGSLLVLAVTGPVSRCQVICVDQATAEKSHHPLLAVSRSSDSADTSTSAPSRAAGVFGIALSPPCNLQLCYLKTGTQLRWVK